MQTSHHKPTIARGSHANIQREALSYIKEFGPLNWNALYVRFNADGSGAIGPALQDLQERKFIEIGSDNIARITALGMAQLRRGA